MVGELPPLAPGEAGRVVGTTEELVEEVLVEVALRAAGLLEQLAKRSAVPAKTVSDHPNRTPTTLPSR